MKRQRLPASAKHIGHGGEPEAEPIGTRGLCRGAVSEEIDRPGRAVRGARQQQHPLGDRRTSRPAITVGYTFVRKWYFR